MNDDAALVEWDWLTTWRATRLHHARLTDEQARDLVDEGYLPSVVTTCGIPLRDVMVPGVMTRMGEMRCEVCCKRLGYPQGKGSPKNDDACRPLVEARL